MLNPQQGANEAPKPSIPAKPQQQSQNQGSPKPADKQPNEQQK
jgi:hypothetical protein